MIRRACRPVLTPLAAMAVLMVLAVPVQVFGKNPAPPPVVALPPAVLQACERPGRKAPRLDAVPLRSQDKPRRRALLEAVCHLAAGRPQSAEPLLREGLQTSPVAQHLFGWYLLAALTAQDKHDAAGGLISAMVDDPPHRLLQKRVRALLARLLTRQPPLPPPVQSAYLEAFFVGRKIEPADYDLMAHWHKMASQDGDSPLSRKLALLMWSHPKDSPAAKQWADFPRRAAEWKIEIPAVSYLSRAVRLGRLRDYSRLADELEPAHWPKMPPAIARSLGRLFFRGLIRKRRLKTAAARIDDSEVLEHFSFTRRQALVWAIRIALRGKKITQAANRLKELEALFPRDRELPAIFVELLRYHQGRKNPAAMNHWLDRLVQEFPDSQQASDGYWFVAWQAIAGKAYPKAEKLLERALKSSDGFHPVDQARLAYWKGRVRMLRGDKTGGMAIWKDLKNRWPYGYYAAMADLKSQQKPLELEPAGKGKPMEDIPPPNLSLLWTIQPYPTALFLFSVGENDLAVELLKRYVSKKLPAPVVKEAGPLFAYIGQHHLQLRLMANNHLGRMRKNPVTDSPFWRRAFPRAHWDVVNRQAETLQVDPYFVLAIMREESRFYNSADSSAGAKGLMQLMPATARFMARRNGMKFDVDDLHHPEVNIPLGSLYLRRVLKRFKGNLFYAAAAYNAGPTQVARWYRRYRHLPLDVFVERIPFAETQAYVKRVFLSYFSYTKLYR